MAPEEEDEDEDPTVEAEVECTRNCLGRGLSRCFCGAAPFMKSKQKTGPLMSDKGLPQEVIEARNAGLEARNRRHEGQALVNLWREASKPRKGGAIKPCPPGCKADVPGLFDQWLQQRGLENTLVRGEDQKGWMVYNYEREDKIVTPGDDWEQAFHGTWWYAVWSVVESGLFLESNDKALGHDFWEPGVYCSPMLDTGIWYARPQILFGDGVYHRIIFEVRVDPSKQKKNRKRGGVQWVFPSPAVALHAVWIRSNAPPANGEERVNSWEADLEACPPGCTLPEPIINPRKGKWPTDYEDENPWDLTGADSPPWLRDAPKTSKPVSKPLQKIAVANSVVKGSTGWGSGGMPAWAGAQANASATSKTPAWATPRGSIGTKATGGAGPTLWGAAGMAANTWSEADEEEWTPEQCMAWMSNAAVGSQAQQWSSKKLGANPKASGPLGLGAVPKAGGAAKHAVPGFGWPPAKRQNFGW